APACNPSRAALMSGVRPSTSGCYLNSDPWKDHIPEGLGLSAQFKNAGYFTAGAGKIYHSSSRYANEWHEYHLSEPSSDTDGIPKGQSKGKKGGIGINKLEGFLLPVAHDIADEDLSDWHNVNFC